MSGDDLKVVDAAFSSVKSMFEAKDAEIERLKRERRELWNQVSDLTEQTLRLITVNRDLGERLAGGVGGLSVN